MTNTEAQQLEEELDMLLLKINAFLGHVFIQRSPIWIPKLALTESIAAAKKVLHAIDPQPACIEGDRCVCGDDLPAVREGCANWRTR